MSTSDKSVELKRWCESVARNIEMFKEGTELMVRSHQKTNVKASSFAIHLSHMSARENSLPVKNALETLSQRLDGIENERSKVLAQLQAAIVNKFDKYPGMLQVQKQGIDTRNAAVKQYAKRHVEFASAKKGGDPKKIDLARGRLESEEKFMRSSEDVLNASLGTFELQRVAEMKDFLGRYIQNEIYLHAKSIEALTQAFQLVAKIDPETEKAVGRTHTHTRKGHDCSHKLFLRRLRELEYQDVKRTAAGSGQPPPSMSVPVTQPHGQMQPTQQQQQQQQAQQQQRQQQLQQQQMQQQQMQQQQMQQQEAPQPQPSPHFQQHGVSMQPMRSPVA